MAFTLGGCLSDDALTRGDARRGGSITVARGSAPATLDPASATDPRTLEALWLVYTPPLTYARGEEAEGAELVPGLAEELPEQSEGGRRWSFRFRPGLRYSDGTRLRASDFRRTVERAVRLSARGRGLLGGIEAIETDDTARTVTLRLDRPDARFPSALASTFAGLVPGDTPLRPADADPPPGVGPYAIAGRRRDGGFALRRSASFSVEGIPRGNLDEVDVAVVAGAERRTQGVVDNRYDLLQGPAPTDSLVELRGTYGERYIESPTLTSVFVELNSTRRPFNDSRVRRAFNLAIDGDRLNRVVLGRLEPSCTVIPPAVPGYSAPDPCPFGAPDGPGDLVEASELIAEADVRRAPVTLWSGTSADDRRLAGYLVSTLRKLGLRARVSVSDRVPRGRSTQAALVRRRAEGPRPAAYLEPLQASQVDDRELTDGVRRLARRPLDEEREERWRELETRLIEGAKVVPIGFERQATFASARLDTQNCLLFHPIYGTDLSSLCLR